jgi:hypothetical protein
LNTQISQRSGQSKRSGGAVDKPAAAGAKKAAAGGAKKAAAPAKRKKAAQVAAGGDAEEQEGEGGEQQQQQQPEAGKGPKFGSVKLRDDEPGAPASQPACCSVAVAAAAICSWEAAMARQVPVLISADGG